MNNEMEMWLFRDAPTPLTAVDVKRIRDQFFQETVPRIRTRGEKAEELTRYKYFLFSQIKFIRNFYSLMRNELTGDKFVILVSECVEALKEVKTYLEEIGEDGLLELIIEEYF